jgi:hypothetical protein
MDAEEKRKISRILSLLSEAFAIATGEERELRLVDITDGSHMVGMTEWLGKGGNDERNIYMPLFCPDGDSPLAVIYDTVERAYRKCL